MMSLNGVYPPMLTPFTTDGTVDERAFRKNMRRWRDEGVAGFVALGSNSETALLTEREKLDLIRWTADEAGGRTVIAGTGLESTAETIRFTDEAATAGAQAALVVTPSYYSDRMGDRALIAHYTAIAGASPIPIFLYNVPRFTHVPISPEAVRVLSSHENIAGMKDSTGDPRGLEAFVRAAAEGFQVIVGTASMLYRGSELGCRAAIMALANVAPRECAEVQTLYAAGRKDEARALNERLAPVNKAVTATYGVAGLKYAADLRGYAGGLVRGPLTELTEVERNEVRKLMASAQMI